MPQASASASSHLLSRRRVALAIPLLGSALWAATAKASTPVLRTQRPMVGTVVDIVVEGPMPSGCAAPPSTPLHACVSWRRC